MNYPTPYEPSPELIEAHTERFKKKRLRTKRKSDAHITSDYRHGVTQVPRDTRPVVGTKYQ